jgi:methylated-DNA-protein-cysteine methyltransferase-like protein
MTDRSNYRERVYEIVRRIPRGRVMTYGQLAEILGDGYTPRTVGFAMHASDHATPWHRVVNARGACSTARVVLPKDKQQRMLEAEGITFDERGCCKLGDYLWIPDRQQNELETSATKVSLFNRLLISARDKK